MNMVNHCAQRQLFGRPHPRSYPLCATVSIPKFSHHQSGPAPAHHHEKPHHAYNNSAHICVLRQPTLGGPQRDALTNHRDKQMTPIDNGVVTGTRLTTRQSLTPPGPTQQTSTDSGDRRERAHALGTPGTRDRGPYPGSDIAVHVTVGRAVLY